MELVIEEKPSEISFVSRARSFTTRENVPDAAWLLVLKLTTAFESVALLLKKSPLVDKKRDSVLRVLTMPLKV